MLDRCYNPNNPEYARYGGNGVRVCEQWQVFQGFLNDMGERPAGTSIDRFPDKDGNYEPSNCRWATPHEQTVNRKVTKLTLEMARQIHTCHEGGESNADIARHFGISPCHVSLIIKGDKWKTSKTVKTDAEKS